MSITKGSNVTGVKLLRPAAGGKAIAKLEQQVIIVHDGVVGDIADIEITAVKGNYLEANIVKLQNPSDTRTEPRCQHYEQCGGCQLQHTQYPYQLDYKQEVLNDTLQRIGTNRLPNVKHIISAENTFYYRNKLSFSFSNNCWQVQKRKARSDYIAGIGFHLANAPEQVLNIEQCYLQSPLSNQITDDVRAYAHTHKLSCYDFIKNRGLLRNLVIRQNRNGELMLIFQVSYDGEVLNGLLEHLLLNFSEVASLYYVVNTDRNDNFLSLPLVHYSGSAKLQDSLGKLNYEISPKAFYQTNPEQTERLYKQVESYAAITPSDTVYDLYCGTGTIGLWLAHAARKVIGIEQNPDAIKDAQHNAVLNHIENAEFYAGKAETRVNDVFIKANGTPDVVVVDPPRAGLDKALIQQLNSLKPSRLIYVSCEPASFARDLKLLSDAFEVSEITAVDMFPQTYHIEAVAKLTPLKKKRAVVKKKRSLKY